MNLPDAQNHPAFAYRPETGEEPYASMLAVPVRPPGDQGVLVVQNRSPRRTPTDEVECWKRWRCCWPRCCGRGPRRRAEGVGATVPRTFGGSPGPGIVIGPVVGRRPRRTGRWRTIRERSWSG